MTYPLKVKVTQYRANRLVVSNWINLSNGHFRGQIRGWVTHEQYSFKTLSISCTMILVIIRAGLMKMFVFFSKQTISNMC